VRDGRDEEGFSSLGVVQGKERQNKNGKLHNNLFIET